MLPVSLIAGAALGAGQLAYGAAQKRKAQRAAAANVMPKYNIAPEEAQMLRQEESMAGQGMSDASREALRANTDRSQGQSIDAILRGGGNPNAISALANNTQTQLNQMAVYDDQARLQNLARLQAARARMSANRDKQYQINDYQPWANKAQAITQQLAGAQNMMTSGLNTASMGILNGIGNLGNKAPQRQYYTPQEASMQPMNTDMGAQNAYQPGYTNIPSYEPNMQPFGMMNENIDNTPEWNGFSFD